MVHILRVARVARVNVETRKALRGVARAELGRAGLEGGSCKSRLKAPKFEKWLNGAPPQAELNKAIEALQQLREKRQQSGGEGPSVMRTARTKGARARFGASKVALGKILRGKLMPGFGVQTRHRRKVKGAAPSWLEMLKSSLKEATTAPTGDGGRVAKGPIVDSAAQVPVHSARDRDQLTNIRPCDLVVTGVTGTVRATEQADRLLAGGDIKMPDGVILDTKDSLVPTDTILDQGYINVQFKTVTGRKNVFVPDGTHPRLEGDPARHPIHCVRDGKDWRMTLEQPSGLANDLEVQQAEAKGRQAVMEQTRRGGIRHSVQMHSPADPLCEVCQEANVPDRAKSTPKMKVSREGLSVGFDIAGPFEKWMLKLKDVNFGLQWAEPMKDKSSSSVLVALQEGIYRMRQMASDDNAKVVRLHADDDSSFGAEVYAWIQDKNYLKTRTGGYDHDGNAAAERSIKPMRSKKFPMLPKSFPPHFLKQSHQSKPTRLLKSRGSILESRNLRLVLKKHLKN